MDRRETCTELVVSDGLVHLRNGDEPPEIAGDRAELTDSAGRIGRQYTAPGHRSTAARSEYGFPNVVRYIQPAHMCKASNVLRFVGRKADVEPFAALCLHDLSIHRVPFVPRRAERSDPDAGTFACELSGAEGDATSLSCAGRTTPQALYAQPPACVLKKTRGPILACCASSELMLAS